ncbi:MAG: hypothetical protein ACI4KH_07825 [Oscillospiraceae bacterium]
MKLKKITAVFLFFALTFTLCSCSQKKLFGNAESFMQAKEEISQAVTSGEDYYIKTISCIYGETGVSEYYRKGDKEVRRIEYDNYSARFIKTADSYIVIDDIKKCAAIYPIKNAHDEVMYADTDFIFTVAQLVGTDAPTYSVTNDDGSLTEIYTTGDEKCLFLTADGKLRDISFYDKDEKLYAEYFIEYGEKGDKTLFDYNGYTVTDMRKSQEE